LRCASGLAGDDRHDPVREAGPPYAEIAALRERDAIRDGRLLLVSGAVLAVVTAAFVLHTVLHLEPSVVAMVGGLLLLALSGLDAGSVARDVECRRWCSSRGCSSWWVRWSPPG
jgi:Na+/H+ antiporter NhaD/arsenite permease-like protein